MKKIALISILALLPVISFAAINIQKTSGGATLTTSNNVYTAGNTINISQEEPGDVFAAGSLVSVTANIKQDLFAVASNLNITSRIGGDVRAAGGNVNVSGEVDGELMLAGGQVTIAPSSAINGDFLAAGGKISIAGTINGNGKIGADEIYISGVLNKDVDVKAKSLIIEKAAVINGNINYSGEKEAVINEGAKINGKISFTKIEVKKAKTAAGLGTIFSIFWLIKFLAMAVAALILFFLFRKNISRIAAETVDNFWKKLLRGFIILIVVPAAIILSFITVIGFPLGLFGVALYGLLIVIAAAFSGIVVAELLNRLFFRKERAKPLNWLMIVLGSLIMALLGLIPVVGWVAKFVIFLVSLGAISNLLYKQNKVIAE